MKNIGTIICVLILYPTVLNGCTGSGSIESMTEGELIEYARGIHERTLTVDTHDDIPFNFASDEVDPGDPENSRQVTLPKMEEGGLDVGFFVVYVGQAKRTPAGNRNAYEQAVTKFDAIHPYDREDVSR